MSAGLLRTLMGVMGAAGLLVLAGCTTDPGDCGGFGCGDDDDAGDEFECPARWMGFVDDQEEWAGIVVVASADEDFSPGARNYDTYDIQVGGWNIDDEALDEADNPGPCFTDWGGMFVGDGPEYEGAVYGVAHNLENPEPWPGGSIQVLPTNGDYPYPLGDPSSLRGTAIEPDGTGGFVVCGSIEDGVDNSILWIDSEGMLQGKDDLPVGGCYDLYLTMDGTYLVTDVVEGLVYRYDLEYGDFTELGDLPANGPHGTGDWVVAEDADTTIYLADDESIYTMAAEGGTAEYYAELLVIEQTHGAETLRMSYQAQLDAITFATTWRDLPASDIYGPASTKIASDLGPNNNPGAFWYNGWRVNELVVDYELLDLQDYIDHNP